MDHLAVLEDSIMKRKLCLLIFLSLLSMTMNAEEGSNKNKEVLTLSWIDPWTILRGGENFKVFQPEKNMMSFQGFRNEFIVGALLIRSRDKADIQVAFQGDREAVSSLSLKPVGEVEIKNSEGSSIWVPDALFDHPPKMGDLSDSIRNWDTIRDFPLLHFAPSTSATLWISIDTYALPPGAWKGEIKLTDNGKELLKAPLEITIHNIELPEDNPILGHTWSTYNEDEELARTVKTYGINACGYYDNWEMLRKNGFRFFRFSFPLSNWHASSLESDDDSIVYHLKPIQETIEKLKLKPEEWALEIFDEPFDKNAWAYMAWVLKIRRQWPEVRFYANPGFSATNKNFATVEHTIEPLKNYVSLWCPYEEYLRKPEFMKALWACGKPIWFYTIEYSHQKPAPGGRRHPWLAWRMKLDGWAFYSLKEYGKDHPWKENSCSRMYPGHTMSLWMEGLRQGVGDYKRLWLLGKKGVSYETLTENIKALLQKGEDAPWGGAEPETYEKMRKRLDEMILEKFAGKY